MSTEEYAEQNGWKLQPWKGENSQNLQVWEKEFGENHKVLVGHDIFTAVVFYREDQTILRSRRRGHGDFIAELDTLLRVDHLKGIPWDQQQPR